MSIIVLAATNAMMARAEIKRRWPGQDVNYTGYDKKGDPVFLSLVRGKTDGYVATARKGDVKAVTFTATIS